MGWEVWVEGELCWEEAGLCSVGRVKEQVSLCGTDDELESRGNKILSFLRDFRS